MGECNFLTILEQDAEKALDILVHQTEVDANHITLIGHSEGTTIVPRVAIDNPGKVNNIVLMGALAQNLRNIGLLPGSYAPGTLRSTGSRPQSQWIAIGTRSVRESCFHLYNRKKSYTTYSKHYF